MDNAEKVLENRMRRTLARRGYYMEKSRRRDERAVDYGRYWVWDDRHNLASIPAAGTASANATVTLDDIVRWADSATVPGEEGQS